MCVVDLVEVSHVCGSNVPGNVQLMVANHDDIVSVPAATDKVISGDIVMVATKTFKAFEFTEDTCQHVEEANDSGSVTGTITARFDRDNSAKRGIFSKMPNGKYTVLITDGNGVTKLIRKARFKANFDSGTAGEDVNAYTVTFTYVGAPADIYTGEIPE